jgi:hypothetical protein
VLPLFLEALRHNQPEGDALRDELQALGLQVQQKLSDKYLDKINCTFFIPNYSGLDVMYHSLYYLNKNTGERYAICHVIISRNEASVTTSL